MSRTFDWRTIAALAVRNDDGAASMLGLADNASAAAIEHELRRRAMMIDAGQRERLAAEHGVSFSDDAVTISGDAYGTLALALASDDDDDAACVIVCFIGDVIE